MKRILLNTTAFTSQIWAVVAPHGSSNNMDNHHNIYFNDGTKCVATPWWHPDFLPDWWK